MEGRDRRRFSARVRLLLLLFFCGVGLVVARAVQLQIYQHDELARLARGQYLNDVQVPARRGHVYDRNAEPLAISVDVPSVYAHPAVVTDPRTAARTLASILDQSRDSLYQRLVTERLFVWLERQVTPEVEARVRAQSLPGIGITKESRRFYPHRELAAHIVGFTGVDGHGLEGIERAFDEVLTGEPQVVAIERDGRGRAVLKAGLDPDRRASGADVFLTLDVQIQHAAEAALDAAVKSTRARAAMAVVLDAVSVEVLALAVRPTFNPNLASDTPPEARRNRALTDIFEPGSTLKPLVMAAALERRAVRPDTVLFCENGALTIGDRTIRDTQPHGWLSLTGIIQKSSNICAAKVGQMLGRERFAESLRAFGFGQRTGVSFPGEVSGLLRDPATWSEVAVATISYGHGIAVTALQLATAYRVLAAHGQLLAPRLVRAVRSPEGQMLPVPIGSERRVLRPETTERVRAMLEAAVGPSGTGALAAVRGYRVAGKTGTAQKPDLVAGGYDPKAFVAAFAGFLPAQAPRAVIVVALDEPSTQHTGGTVAAPVFAEIAAATMRVLGVPPTDDAAAPSDPREALVARARALEAPPREGPPVRPGAVPSFVGLTARQVAHRFAEVGGGLDLELHGSGRVVQQEPPPGADRARAERITLVLAE